MKTKAAIELHLKDLVGMSLWAIGRAASLVWFQFGERHTAKDYRGATKEVGTYALHIDCQWSWRKGSEVVADNNSDLSELEGLVSTPLTCNGISASDNGSFELRFDNRTRLVISVEPDADTDADEYWRLFEPELDAPHFVVGPKGVQS
jgi:hypothetical protein